jgi:CheY-like chemotaxis protein
MENILFRNLVYIDYDEENHGIFYDALKQVSRTSRYYAFTDTSDALSMLISKKLKPDVIFLELNMPKMSGQQFLAEIKKNEELKNIPVLVISSSMHGSTIEFMRLWGANAAIRRPSNLRGFTRLLSSVLSFDFFGNSVFICPALHLEKSYKGINISVPEEVFMMGPSERGIHLN